MIYTLTLNPAIDLFITTQDMQPNRVNRTQNYEVQANGKGVNVSIILQRLGTANTALGVGAGFTLDYISSFLTAHQIPNYFLKDQGITRINVFTRVLNQGQEYKLVNAGPIISPAIQAQLMQRLKKLTAQDWLCVCGSFAQGIQPAYLKKIGQLSQQQGFKLVVDTAYAEVLQILPYRPYLIKPNVEELAAWFHQPAPDNLTQIVTWGQSLVLQGAQNVLVSLGAQGAVLITDRQILYGTAPVIHVLNTAGAGDTMLGTFVAGRCQGLTDEANLVKAIAAGSDTAQKSWLTTFQQIEELQAQIKIQTLSASRMS